MSLAYAVGRAAVNTSTGNQDFSVSLGGLTPKLALFRLVRATADDSPGAHAYYCRGATDGVTSATFVFGAEDNVATSIGRHGVAAGAAASTDCVRLPRVDNTADLSNVSSALRWVSFGADKVTLNVRIAPPAGWLLEYVLLAGTDLAALVDSFVIMLGAGASTDRTGLGVPADAAVLWANTKDTGMFTGCTLVEGFWAAASHSSRGLTGVDYGTADNPSDSTGTVRDDANKAVAVDGFDDVVTLSQLSTGYRVTAGADGHTNRLVVIALSFNGKGVAWAGVHSTATSLGSAQLLETPKLRPRLALAGFSRRSSLNDKSQSDDSAVFGGGSWTPSAQYAQGVSSKNNVSPTVAKEHAASRFLSISREDGTLTVSGTPIAADAVLATASQLPRGLSFSYSGTSSIARRVPLLLIGDETVQDPTAVPLPLVVPAVTRLVAGGQTPSPTALPLVVPAPTVVAPKQPAAVSLLLVLPAATVFTPTVQAVFVPPELGPSYAEALAGLLPRGLAWPRRSS